MIIGKTTSLNPENLSRRTYFILVLILALATVVLHSAGMMAPNPGNEFRKVLLTVSKLSLIFLIVINELLMLTGTLRKAGIIAFVVMLMAFVLATNGVKFVSVIFMLSMFSVSFVILAGAARKTSDRTFGLLAALLVTAGALTIAFKVLHWPGAAICILLEMLLMTIIAGHLVFKLFSR